MSTKTVTGTFAAWMKSSASSVSKKSQSWKDKRMRVRDIPPRLPGKTRTRAERVADAAAYEVKLRLEKGFTPEVLGFQKMTAEELIKLEWWCSHDHEMFVMAHEADEGRR
ncbi:MAG: hypothetical protein WBQ54_20515 [Pseudolabrys sp.]